MGILNGITNRLTGLFGRRPTGLPLTKAGPVGRIDAVMKAEQARQSSRSATHRIANSREKLPAQSVAAAIGKKWFLPYADSSTGETATIRAAYRLMPANEMVKAALYTKILAVASLDWQVQPANEESPRDREAADFCKFNVERLPGGMPSIITGMLYPHLVDGFSLGEKIITCEHKERRWNGKYVLDNIKPKDTNNIRLIGDAFNNITDVESTLDRDQSKYPIREFVYTRNMPIFDNPLGTSDLRAAYKHFWMADTVTKLRAIHAEKYTSPFLLGEYEDDDQQSGLEDALAAARAGTWMSVPAGVKVQSLTMAAAGESDYKSFLDDCSRNILIGIVGAYLQTLEGQVSDARGDTQVSKSIVELFQWMLAVTVQEMFNRQVFTDLIDWNYAGCGYPRLTLGGVSEQELQAMIATFTGAQGLGLKLSRSSTYERLGIQPPSDPEDELAAAAPPGGAPPGAGGAPGMGFPGGLPFSEQQYQRFAAEGWKGPFKGERGGTYWTSPSGEKSYDPPGESEGGEQTKDAAPAAGLPAFNPAKAQALEAHAAGVAASMTKPEKAAIEDYVQGISDDVNAELRAGREPKDRDLRAVMVGLDSMLEKAPPLPVPVKTYRGLTFKSEQELSAFTAQMESNQRDGKPLTMPSYTSVSADPKIATDFLNNQGRATAGGVVFEVTAKKGVYVEGLTASKTSRNEHELILPRNGQFKPTGKRQAVINGKPTTVYELEQL